MADLSQQPLWHNAVYQIERKDPLMGGEYGIVNVAPRQLADRTLWLLETFLKAHKPDGSHVVTDKDISDNAGITEDRLALDYSINEMFARAQSLRELIDYISWLVEALKNFELSEFSYIFKALLISWRFGYPRFQFELFRPQFSLRDDFEPVPIIETISGDDSIDVEDSSTLKEDECYVIYDEDENRATPIVVKKILTKHRVILYSDETITRPGTGVITRNCWGVKNGLAYAKTGAIYTTAPIDMFSDFESGNLVIAHLDDADFKVETQRTPTFWHGCPKVNKQWSDELKLWRSVYQLPQGTYPIRVTALTDATVSHICLMSDTANTLKTTVRTPIVMDSDFAISRFGALYGAKHTATHFELSRDLDFTRNTLRFSFGPDYRVEPIWDFRNAILDQFNLNEGERVWWRAKYDADDGYSSRYSLMCLYIRGALPE